MSLHKFLAPEARWTLTGAAAQLPEASEEIYFQPRKGDNLTLVRRPSGADVSIFSGGFSTG
jgi:hypothetical protein